MSRCRVLADRCRLASIAFHAAYENTDSKAPALMPPRENHCGETRRATFLLVRFGATAASSIAWYRDCWKPRPDWYRSKSDEFVGSHTPGFCSTGAPSSELPMRYRLVTPSGVPAIACLYSRTGSSRWPGLS